jgi:hypothetical protein
MRVEKKKMKGGGQGDETIEFCGLRLCHFKTNLFIVVTN